MNRRRFLKYSGTVAAVVGASALGLDYYLRHSPSTMTPITSTTVSSELTASSSTSTQAVQLASLQGRLFFDYNGNGVQDGEEPAVTGAAIQLRDLAGAIIAETFTDSSGDYKLEDIKAGSYRVRVVADKRFGYMCMSLSEFRKVSEDYDIPLRDSGKMDIGLMEGFLTLPLPSKTKYSIGRYYDWDPDPETSLWWNGRIGNEPWNHSGIDYDTKEGEDVVAPAPGELYPIERGPQGQLSLGLYHPSAGLSTCYNHLSKVLNKTYVTRGEKIAETGSTGASYPHLHFNTATKIVNHDAFLDPYRPLFAVKKKNNGYWAREQGKDFWQTVFAETNPNLENFWTKDNEPQYATT